MSGRTDTSSFYSQLVSLESTRFQRNFRAILAKEKAERSARPAKDGVLSPECIAWAGSQIIEGACEEWEEYWSAAGVQVGVPTVEDMAQ